MTGSKTHARRRRRRRRRGKESQKFLEEPTIENLVTTSTCMYARWQNSSGPRSEWSFYCISWRRNVGTRYLEISWRGVRSSKSSYPHRWHPTGRETWRWTRRVGDSTKTYAERSNRRLALPVQRVKRTRFFLEGTLNIRMQIRLASKDPPKGTTDDTRSLACYYLACVARGRVARPLFKATLNWI